MPSPARTMPITVASWSTSSKRAHLQRMHRRVEVLAHAAGPRQVDERIRRQIARAQARRRRERMVARTDQVEAVGAEQLGRAAPACRRAIAASAKSAWPARTCSMQASDSTSATCSSMPGWSARKSASTVGSQPAASDGSSATETRPRRRAAKSRAVVERRIDLGEHAPRRGLELAPLGRQLDVARAAVEQARAERLLERADQRAEGRLRQVRQRGRAREAALLGEGDEGAQLAGRDIHLHLQINRSILSNSQNGRHCLHWRHPACLLPECEGDE